MPRPEPLTPPSMGLATPSECRPRPQACTSLIFLSTFSSAAPGPPPTTFICHNFIVQSGFRHWSSSDAWPAGGVCRRQLRSWGKMGGLDTWQWV